MSLQFRVLGNRISRTGTGSRMWKIFLFGTVLLLTWFPVKSFSAVVYVDQDRPGGNGSSWETAHNTIEGAIADSGEGQEFWVAEGTYTPSDPLTPKPGSQFYGGFAGNETARDQRDIGAHPAIVDGQNSLNHVIFVNLLATGVRVDGITIKRGNADAGEGWDTYGGGIFVDQQPVTIANCTFTGNSSAVQGGGLLVNRTSATVQNCKFQSNASAYGGAVAGFQSTLSISDCEFTSNSAEEHGGAVYNDGGSTVLSNCTLTQNNSAAFGGAVSVNRGPATVDRCEFQNNSSAAGGGLSGYDSDLTISECVFDSNKADQGVEPRGGALWINLKNPEISKCTFSSNSSNHLSGAIDLNNTPNALVSGCDFLYNSAVAGGGGLSGLWDEVSSKPSVTVSKCSFQANSSGLEGGGVYSYICHFLFQQTTFLENSGVNGGAIMLDYVIDNPSRVERCIFIGNSATTVGGAIRCYEQSVEVENSLFVSNSAPNAGAIGTHAGEASEFTVVLTNCTLYGNKAEKADDPDTQGFGGAMLNTSVPMVNLNNCIFWGNEADAEIWNGSGYNTTPDVFNAASSSMTTRYTDMESLNWAHGSVSEIHVGSFSSDPMFEDPDGADNIEGTLDDNFRLTLDSPCLDHADGDNAPDLDIDFEQRRDLVGVPNLGTGTPPYGDLGPYETQPVSFVNQDDGTCGGNVPCYTSIQEAIDASSDGTNIKVVEGDYDEAIILSSPENLGLFGGWDSAFSNQWSTTEIESLTINSGTLRPDHLVIR